MSHAFDLFIQRVSALPHEQLIAETKALPEPADVSEMARQIASLTDEKARVQSDLNRAFDEIHRLRGMVERLEAQKRSLMVARDKARADAHGLKREIRHLEIGIRALDRAEAA